VNGGAVRLPVPSLELAGDVIDARARLEILEPVDRPQVQRNLAVAVFRRPLLDEFNGGFLRLDVDKRVAGDQLLDRSACRCRWPWPVSVLHPA